MTGLLRGEAYSIVLLLASQLEKSLDLSNPTFV